jgi:two-component system cell cycle response regulator
MVYLLTAFGHETIQALDGAKGVEVAQREHPDLILLDIHMPRMDGYEVANQLRRDSQCCRIPLVAVTALAMVGDRERILASGFNGYIPKPIDAELFLSQINAYISSPQKEPPAVSVQTAPQPSHWDDRPLKKRGVILFVDKTQTNIDLLRSVVEPSGFELAAALSAKEGLDLARRVRPDLILSDVHMPHEDGYCFLRMVQNDAELRRIPFVFLSASIWSAREKVQALERGATKFISRPIEPQVLLSEIEACLQKGSRA